MGSVENVQTALVAGPNEDIVLSHTAPLPPSPLEDDQIAIEVAAISLNPVDTKMLGQFHTAGAISGCEYAGTVTAVGPKAAAEWNISSGDRVSAAIMGMNPRRPRIGGFAQYSVAPGHCVLKTRNDWSFAKAAGIGNAWYTVSWALFYVMGLAPGPKLQPFATWIEEFTPELGPWVTSAAAPGKAPPTVLVWGGSSSTGTCAIQLLKLAGFTVIATSSAHNIPLVKSYGADEVFDYTTPSCADDIRAHTRNSLRSVLDCITTPETTRQCYSVLGRSGGRYVSLDPFSELVAATRKIVRAAWVLGPELMGEEIAWPVPHGRPANPFAKKFCVEWNRTLQRLLDAGEIQTHPQIVRDTGLAGALGGMEDIRAKKVSGKKLIYTL